MPATANKENMALLLSVIESNPGINKKELIALSGLKKPTVVANVAKMKEQGAMFVQNSSGKDVFFSHEYAEANDVPLRVFKQKKSYKKKAAPKKKVSKTPNFDGQMMFNRLLFQAAR